MEASAQTISKGSTRNKENKELKPKNEKRKTQNAKVKNYE